MVAGLFLLLLALVRWGESWRLHSQNEQRIALRDDLRSSPSQPPMASRGLPGLVPSLPSSAASLAPGRPSGPATAPLHFVQTQRQVASRVVQYLGNVNTLEHQRLQLWRDWWERAAPQTPTPTPGPDGLLPPTLPVPDLILAAGQWDKALSGSLPDSTCLPFHLAYLHYLALEKDYIQRLVFAQQQGDTAACLRLRDEQAATLSAAAQRVQAKLRDLQREHPELSPELKGLAFTSSPDIR
jgi:hypothetical protein